LKRPVGRDAAAPRGGEDPGRWVREESAGLWGRLQGRTVGVLGYGNQGRAQALNLRDSGRSHGFRVLVGARPGGGGDRRAREDGFVPVPVEDLAPRAELLVSLLPDEIQRDVLHEGVFPASPVPPPTPPPLLCLAHGFSLLYGGLTTPTHWDVVLVAPTGPGKLLRERFLAGSGLPGLVAVARDASGDAENRALALAQAIGLIRGGAYVTTVESETVIDLFGEQAVLCGGLLGLALAAYDALVERGFPPDLAYMECVQQVGVTADLLARHGPSGFRERISRTALYGALTRGPRIINDQVRRNLAEILDEVSSGRFGREWMDDVARGAPRLRQLLEAARRHPANGTFTRLTRPDDPPEEGGSI